VSSLDFELKEWDASRRYVTAEMVLLTAATAALVWLAPALAAGNPVLHFLLLVLLVAHATGCILLVQHAVTLLIRPCPRCAQSFYGLPHSLPLPLRRSCAGCGLRLGPSDSHEARRA
jgi:hypothetical protein